MQFSFVRFDFRMIFKQYSICLHVSLISDMFDKWINYNTTLPCYLTSSSNGIPQRLNLHRNEILLKHGRINCQYLWALHRLHCFDFSLKPSQFMQSEWHMVSHEPSADIDWFHSANIMRMTKRIPKIASYIWNMRKTMIKKEVKRNIKEIKNLNIKIKCTYYSCNAICNCISRIFLFSYSTTRNFNSEVCYQPGQARPAESRFSQAKAICERVMKWKICLYEKKTYSFVLYICTWNSSHSLHVCYFQ